MPDAMLVCVLGLSGIKYIPQTASAAWHSLAVNY